MTSSVIASIYRNGATTNSPNPKLVGGWIYTIKFSTKIHGKKKYQSLIKACKKAKI